MVSKLVTSLTLAVLTLGIGSRAEAQPADNRTYFTFSAPVTLPGITLPAGKYIFRLADPDSSRKVINVLSGDGKQSLAMLHTIPNQVTTAPKDAEIRFMETSAKVPPPVKTWWYAGRSIGYEFIYPRKQALELAKTTSEPILTTAEDTDDLAGAGLARVKGSENEAVKIEDNPAPQAAAGRAQQADVAPSQPSEPPVGGNSTAAAQNPRADERARTAARTAERTELPRTATSLPVVLLFGVLSMLVGFGLSRRSSAGA